MTATELISRILPGHASGKHAQPAPEPGDGSEFWGNTGTTGVLNGPEALQALPDPYDDLPPLPAIACDPDAPCAVCGDTSSPKLPAAETGRYAPYPLCHAIAGCNQRVAEAARKTQDTGTDKDVEPGHSPAAA